MTIRFVILWQILLNLLLVLAVKWVYIGQFVPLRCEVRFSHTVNSQVIFATELILCFAFHIAGYSKAKQLLRSSSRTIGGRTTTKVNSASLRTVRFVFKWRQEEPNEEIEMKSLTNAESSLEQAKNNITPTLSSSTDNKITIHRSKSSVANLEMKATRSFLIGVIPLLVLPCPMLLYSLSFNLICIPLYGGDKCIGYFWLFPYFRALIGLHVLVYVVITVARNNKDFSWPFSSSCFTHTTDLAQWYG